MTPFYASKIVKLTAAVRSRNSMAIAALLPSRSINKTVTMMPGMEKGLRVEYFCHWLGHGAL